MIALLTTYLLGLLFLTFRNEPVLDRRRFRLAWVMFAMIPLCHAFFTLIRAMAFTSREHNLAENLALVTVWNEGAVWLLFAVSLFCLICAVLQNDATGGTATKPPQPGDPAVPQPGSPAHPSRSLQ